MAILAAVFFVCTVYNLGKDHFRKWFGKKVDDDDEEVHRFRSFTVLSPVTNVNDRKSIAPSAAFYTPVIALPPRSATFGRLDYPSRYQERLAYISQADMLRSGRGFFG
jgi:hypothetical protein